jgi:hypothetical protein
LRLSRTLFGLIETSVSGMESGGRARCLERPSVSLVVANRVFEAFISSAFRMIGDSKTYSRSHCFVQTLGGQKLGISTNSRWRAVLPNFKLPLN